MSGICKKTQYRLTPHYNGACMMQVISVDHRLPGKYNLRVDLLDEDFTTRIVRQASYNDILSIRGAVMPYAYAIYPTDVYVFREISEKTWNRSVRLRKSQISVRKLPTGSIG